MGKIKEQELSQDLKNKINEIENISPESIGAMAMYRGTSEPTLTEEEKELGGQLWVRG